MNNSLFPSIPPEVEDYFDVMTPEEHLEDFILEFQPEPEIEDISMFEIHEKLCSYLIESGYGCVNIVGMPKEINKYNFLKSTFYDGFEVHKKDSKYLKDLLDDLNIHYTLSNRGKGRRNYDFLILEDDDFRHLYSRMNEIPVLVGDDLI